MKASICEVELEYPVMINGQEVIVKRYEGTKCKAQVSDHSNLSFHSRERLNNTAIRGPQRRSWRRS